MNYSRFKQLFRNQPLIKASDAVRFVSGAQVLRNQLNRWQARGLIIRLKRGVYLLNPDDRLIEPGREFIAGQLYSPSYVSMEYALSRYGLIPERVSAVTSVTTKKTARFRNSVGDFTYQHVKPQAFRGFLLRSEGNAGSFFIAAPEKAVVDLFYFNLRLFKSPGSDVFEQFWRFQNTDKLRAAKLRAFARDFANLSLTGAVERFCAFIKERS